jgi:dihydroorotate dehydrogenase electron transfer subunit
MSLPIYPDHAWHGTVAVVENARMAHDTYRIRFACPEIARQILPGQFLMLRLAGCNDPLLGRPLAMYNVILNERGEPWFVDVVYMAIGKMTHLLAEFRPGAKLEVWGPLGNGFPPTPTEHLIMVAGGIGQTPFLTLAKEYLGRHTFGVPARHVPHASKVTLLYGARSSEHLAGIDDFRHIGATVQVSTDDGSLGHHGLVIDLIRPTVERSAWKCRIVCCGPERMIEATKSIAAELELPCQVSLESPMACGMGICFSCVTKIRDESGNWDYRRTCVEGPVFDAEEVQF